MNMLIIRVGISEWLIEGPLVRTNGTHRKRKISCFVIETVVKYNLKDMGRVGEILTVLEVCARSLA